MKKFNHIKNTLSDHHLNIRSWKSDRKIIVFESDDWGTIRTPSKEVYNNMKSLGYNMDLCPYNVYDTLANSEDLNCLFNVLRKFKDSSGNYPVITANSLVANPNFNKIEQSNFNEYHFELFTDTLKRQYPNENVFRLWQDGIKENIFKPQFHGREHLNVSLWLNDLKEGIPEAKVPFDKNFFGLSRTITKNVDRIYMAAFDLKELSELKQQKNILLNGLSLFKNIFGYKSKSFIAPNYIWHSSLEPFLKELGVTYLQGARAQRQPNGENSTSIKKHFTGDTNSFKQIYLSRNVVFEPSLNKNKNVLKDTLKQIETAFYWGAPAIICTHRLNFIGVLNRDNRDRNLKTFERLLKEIIKKWPNVEFISSDKLGDYIYQDKFN